MATYKVTSQVCIKKVVHVEAGHHSEAAIKWGLGQWKGAVEQTIGAEELLSISQIKPDLPVMVAPMTGAELLDAAVEAAALALVNAQDNDISAWDLTVAARELAHETAICILQAIMDIDGQPARMVLDEAIVRIREEDAR